MSATGEPLDDLIVRPMTLEDAERLSAAFKAIGWRKPIATFQTYVSEEAAGKRWTRVAEWNGQAAGYVTLLWESQDPDLRKRGVPEIVDLNVLPEFRDRGIGSALLDAAELEASNRRESVGIRVGLHKGYGPAQRMYVRRGYVPDGSGVVVRGRIPEEGSNVRLDDDATLRLTKLLRSGGVARKQSRTRTSDAKRLAPPQPAALRRTRRGRLEAGDVGVVSKAVARWRLWCGGSPTWKR